MIQLRIQGSANRKVAATYMCFGHLNLVDLASSEKQLYDLMDLASPSGWSWSFGQRLLSCISRVGLMMVWHWSQPKVKWSWGREHMKDAANVNNFLSNLGLGFVLYVSCVIVCCGKVLNPVIVWLYIASWSSWTLCVLPTESNSMFWHVPYHRS